MEEKSTSYMEGGQNLCLVWHSPFRPLQDSNEWKTHVPTLPLFSIYQAQVDVFSRASLPTAENRPVPSPTNLKMLHPRHSAENPHSWEMRLRSR
jgi:hypothetical protein